MDIVFATHNRNKLIEVQNILPKNINLLSLEDIKCHEEIIESADSIEGNARIKANYVYEHYNYPCFADDTGLFVDVLNGEPGVYSARFAGPQKSAKDNNNKLLQLLKNTKNRKAYFKTVIAYKTSTAEKIFTGICNGIIISAPKGHHGFGYDPIFKPENFEDTFATLDPEIKNRISHRALAITKFLTYLQTE
jgi:XTP/dITP diphosphohydrolase